MRAAAVIDRDNPAVVWRVRVRARAEKLAERRAERHEEPAGGTRRWCRVRQGRAGTVIRRIPALGRLVASDRRQHAFAPVNGNPNGEAHIAFAAAPGGYIVAATPGRHIVAPEYGDRNQSFVVVERREQISDAEIARLQTVAPGYPCWSEQCVRPGHKRTLAHRHGLGSCRAGYRHGPAPATVGGVETFEQMRDDAIAVGLRPDICTHLSGSGNILSGGSRNADRLRADLVKDRGPVSHPYGAHIYQFSIILALPGASCGHTVSFRCPIRRILGPWEQAPPGGRSGTLPSGPPELPDATPARQPGPVARWHAGRER